MHPTTAVFVLLQDGVPRAFPAVRGNWPSAVELDLRLDADFAEVVDVGAAHATSPHSTLALITSVPTSCALLHCAFY
jgi:hypothetical protein